MTLTIKNVKYLLNILGVLLLGLLLISCDEENGDSGTPTNPGIITGLPDDPGTGNLAGKIVGTLSGDELSGLRVSVGRRSTTTDAYGNFWLNGVGEGTLAVYIEGAGIYSRTAAIDTANGRSQGIDVIERKAPFHLGFYRELARGNHPEEKDMYPTHRWINPSPPTFYIDTDASATLDGLIDQNQISITANIIRQMAPIWTGQFYTSVKIVPRPFSRLDFDLDIPDNSYVISFDDYLMTYGTYGITLTDPSFVLPNTSAINKTVILLVDDMDYYRQGGIDFEEIIAHEMGHGFGFRHTSLLSSVMLPVGAYGGLYSEYDRIHAAVVYSRPAGNTDIDNDPIPGGKRVGQPMERQVFIDRRADIPSSPELLERLQNLDSKLPREALQRLRSENF